MTGAQRCCLFQRFSNTLQLSISALLSPGIIGCQVKMPTSLSPTEIEYELAHIHDNRSPDIVISAAICISLAIIAVALRLFARRLSKVKILADDYTTICALVSQQRA